VKAKLNRLTCRLVDLDDDDTSWLTVPETAGHKLRRLLAELDPDERRVRYENLADGLNSIAAQISEAVLHEDSRPAPSRANRRTK
jgi:hypothetical protein